MNQKVVTENVILEPTGDKYFSHSAIGVGLRWFSNWNSIQIFKEILRSSDGLAAAAFPTKILIEILEEFQSHLIYLFATNAFCTGILVKKI